MAEYLHHNIVQLMGKIVKKVFSFLSQLFCRQHMEWGERYAAEKATPLVTQWTMRQATQGDRGSGVTPSK